MNLTKFDPHRRSKNRQHCFLTTHPRSYGFSWSRQCISGELGMCLLSARRAELEIRRDDDKWNPLRSTRNQCGFLRHLMFRLQVEASQDFPPLRSSLDASWSRMRVNFRIPYSLPYNWTVPSAIGSMKLSPLFGVIMSFALRLQAWISDTAFPNSPREQCMSEGQSRLNCLTKIDGALTGLSQRWNDSQPLRQTEWPGVF